MIKQYACIEHKVGEKTYRLLCDQDSPIGEIKEFLYQCMADVKGIEQAAFEAEEAKKADAVPVVDGVIEEAPQVG